MKFLDISKQPGLLAILLTICVVLASSCTPTTSNTSSNDSPQPARESKASKDFNSAMENGEFKRGMEILQTEIAARGPKPEYLYNMGLIYQRGAGVKVNFKKASEFYTKAADMGDADAQFNLGSLYENGQGVQKSLKKAISYYRMAAIQGHASAQYNLARLYAFDDRAIPAYVWLSLAAQATGEAKAPSERTRDRIEKKMTKAELVESKLKLSQCSSNLNLCPQ